MAKLLSGLIRKTIAQKLGPQLLPATLTRITPGTRMPGEVSAGTNPTTVDYSCRGFVSDYQDNAIDGTNILGGDRLITLLGGTLPTGVVPLPGDRVTIADFAGATPTTYSVPTRKGAVTSDADGATFTVQGRK